MKHYRNTHKHTQFRFLKMQPYANTGNKGNSIYWDQYYIDSKIIPGNYTIFEHKYKVLFKLQENWSEEYIEKKLYYK